MQFLEILEKLKEASQTYSKEVIGTFTTNIIWAGVIVFIGLAITLAFVRIEKIAQRKMSSIEV